jgi:Tfp pilus assembly protein PilF
MREDTFTKICLELGSSACQRGDYSLAHMMYNTALSPPDCDKVTTLAAALQLIAATYAKQEKCAKAEDFYHKALAVLTETPKADGKTVPEVLDRLGELACKRGDYVQSVQFYKRAMEIEETLESIDKERVRNRATQMAWLYLRQGRLEEAQIVQELTVDDRVKQVS